MPEAERKRKRDHHIHLRKVAEQKRHDDQTNNIICIVDDLVKEKPDVSLPPVLPVNRENETDEEKHIRVRARNAHYSRAYHQRQKADQESLTLIREEKGITERLKEAEIINLLD
jgi:hypothetical protein